MKLCAPALSQLVIAPDGAVKLCRVQRDCLGDSNKRPLAELLDAPPAREVRLALLRGEWPQSCSACRDQEAAGAPSWRVRRNRDFSPEEQARLLDGVERTTGAVGRVSALDVTFSNLCNAACKTCGPGTSTAFGLVARRADHLRRMFPAPSLLLRSDGRERFMDELLALVPGLALLRVGGGEPFIQDELHRFLERIGAEERPHIELRATTNLTRLSHGGVSMLDRLSGFKAVRLSVRVDGPAEVHDYLRYPSKLDAVLSSAREVRARQGFAVTARIAVGALNVLRLPEAIELARTGLGAERLAFSLLDEEHLRVECLPAPLRQTAGARLAAYGRARPYADAGFGAEIDRALAATQERLKATGNTGAFVWYVRAHDEATGQDVLRCVPELAPFLRGAAAAARPAPVPPPLAASVQAPALAPAPLQAPDPGRAIPVPERPAVAPGDAPGARPATIGPTGAVGRSRAAGESPSLCVMPWIHALVQPSGLVKPCAAAGVPPPEERAALSVRERSLTEIFDAPHLRRMREQMLGGEWPDSCGACRQRLETGAPSPRDAYNAAYAAHFQRLREGAEQLVPRIRSLDLRISNLCSFKCRMCSGASSSGWHGEHAEIHPGLEVPPGVVGLHDVPGFWTHLREAIVPHVEELHLGGGEPLMTREHYALLDLLVAAGRTDVALRYETNLSQLSFEQRDVTALWRRFPRVHVVMSLDGVGPLGEYVRHGLDFARWCANVELLKRAAPHVQRSLQFVVSAYNVLDFQKHYDTIVACEFVPQDRIGLALLEWPAYLGVQVLHPVLKEQARRKLLAMAETDPLADDACRRSIRRIIEHMDGADLYPALGRAFAEKTRAMDRLRGEHLLAVAPELALMLRASPDEAGAPPPGPVRS